MSAIRIPTASTKVFTGEGGGGLQRPQKAAKTNKKYFFQPKNLEIQEKEVLKLLNPLPCPIGPSLVYALREQNISF